MVPWVRGVCGVTVVESVLESDDGGGSVVGPLMVLSVTVGWEVGEMWVVVGVWLGTVLV